jgi:hypothetical protein
MKHQAAIRTAHVDSHLHTTHDTSSSSIASAEHRISSISSSASAEHVRLLIVRNYTHTHTTTTAKIAQIHVSQQKRIRGIEDQV